MQKDTEDSMNGEMEFKVNSMEGGMECERKFHG